MNGDGSYPLDPDVAYDRINKVTYYNNDASDAFWHYFVGLVPSEVLERRLKQKVYLARYARISPDFWEGRETNELRAYYKATIELVNEESAISRTIER